MSHWYPFIKCCRRRGQPNFCKKVRKSPYFRHCNLGHENDWTTDQKPAFFNFNQSSLRWLLTFFLSACRWSKMVIVELSRRVSISFNKLTKMMNHSNMKIRITKTESCLVCFCWHGHWWRQSSFALTQTLIWGGWLCLPKDAKYLVGAMCVGVKLCNCLSNYSTLLCPAWHQRTSTTMLGKTSYDWAETCNRHCTHTHTHTHNPGTCNPCCVILIPIF